MMLAGALARTAPAGLADSHSPSNVFARAASCSTLASSSIAAPSSAIAIACLPSGAGCSADKLESQAFLARTLAQNIDVLYEEEVNISALQTFCFEILNGVFAVVYKAHLTCRDGYTSG